MTPKALLLAPACAFAALLFAGCGGAAPSPASPAAEFKTGSEDVSTPEGAAAAVDQAERAIQQILGPSQSSVLQQQAGAVAPQPPPPPPAAASAAPVAPPPAPKPLEQKPAEAAGPKKADAAHGLASDSCSTACAALASMSRAADHLCTLAGAGDARCTSARTRVQAASARVKASCPACGG